MRKLEPNEVLDVMDNLEAEFIDYQGLYAALKHQLIQLAEREEQEEDVDEVEEEDEYLGVKAPAEIPDKKTRKRGVIRQPEPIDDEDEDLIE